MPHRLLVLLTVSTLAGCAWGPSHWAEANETRKIAAAGVAATTVRTHNGTIDIAGVADADTIEVHVRRRGGSSSEAEAKLCLAAIEVVAKRTGDRLELGWRWRTEKQSGWHAIVSFRITQPRGVVAETHTHNGSHNLARIGAACQAYSHNGDLEISDCARSVITETHNGDIRVQGSASDVRITTHNGSVDLDLSAARNLAGLVETHNGRIALQIGDGTAIDLHCSTDNGAISVKRQLGGGSVAGGNRKELNVKVGTPSGRLRVKTHNGGIVVR